MVLLCLSCSVSNSQTLDPTTGNLIDPAGFSGTVPAAGFNGLSGGNQPGYISNQRAIVFGYNQGTASQSIGVAAALSAAGTGVELKGYDYSWYYYNNDLNRGSLTGNISLKGATGNVLESYNYTMPQTGIGNWIQQSGHQSFTNPYLINQVSNLDVSFTGKDDRWWAGYYGPAIKSIDVRLSYGVNPCATNPAYSPSCPGFNDLLTSINLVPYPNATATWGSPVNNSYPIGTVLANSGSGLQLHGFKYGFTVDVGGSYCNSMFLFWCDGWTNSTANVGVGIHDNQNRLLYGNNHSFGYTNGPQEMNYQYLFPTSTNTNLMGNFSFTAAVDGYGSVSNMYSKMIVTADPCMTNPLYSSTCTGYQEAIDKLTGTNKTNYTETGYTEPLSVTTGTASPTAITYTSTPTGSVVEIVPTTTSSSGSTFGGSSSAAAATVVSATPSVNNPQPKVGEVTDSAKSSLPMSTILNMVRSEQSRISAVENNVVSAADAQALAISDSTKKDAEAVAFSAATQSQQLSGGPSSGTGISLAAIQSFQSSSGFGLSQSQNRMSVSSRQYTVESESNRNETNRATSATSVYQMNESRPIMIEQLQQQQMSSVKKNVPNNELAGGVDINAMAKVPVGFGQYSMMMPDVAFYAPKEIYKNQKTVDNARVMRGLTGGSDRLHQEMVDQQYNRGN